MSNDRTITIAKQFGAKIVQHPYDTEEKFGGAVAQINRSIDMASGDWIFVLDGGEFPSIQLGYHLKLIAKEAYLFGYDSVAFNRLNYISGILHKNKSGEQREDMHIRLFEKNLRYVGRHSEGVFGCQNTWSLPMYHFYHCRALEREVLTHEEDRHGDVRNLNFPSCSKKNMV